MKHRSRNTYFLYYSIVFCVLSFGVTIKLLATESPVKSTSGETKKTALH